MSRKPYVPCAGGCGNLLYPGRGSLPPGQMTCRACRRARRVPRQELRSCAACGAEFRAGRGHGRHMTACSDPCADIRQRNRYRAKCRARRGLSAGTWDGVTDEQILDRDGWRCGICTRKINRLARWPHPDSKSVDHIVPLSKGGDDTAANKQAAHLGCNLRKSDRGAGQLALFG